MPGTGHTVEKKNLVVKYLLIRFSKVKLPFCFEI